MVDAVNLAEISNISASYIQTDVFIQYNLKLFIFVKPIPFVFNLTSIFENQVLVLSQCKFSDIVIFPVSVFIPWENTVRVALYSRNRINISNNSICVQDLTDFEKICRVDDLSSCNKTRLEIFLRLYISQKVS